MNHRHSGFRTQVGLLSPLILSWLLVNTAQAQTDQALPQPAPPKVEQHRFHCKYVTDRDMFRILNEVLGAKPSQRFAINFDGQGLTVYGSPEEMALVKRLISAVDAPLTMQARGDDQQVEVFNLRHVAADNSLDQALRVVFGTGNPNQRGRFALDRQRNAVIAQGDKSTLEVVATVLARLEKAQNEPRPAEVQVRIVWLICGPRREDLPKPPDDLKEVLAELAKIGITDPGLAAQTVVRAVMNVPFQASGSVELTAPCRLRISGTVHERVNEAPGLEIAVDATQERAKGGTTPFCHLETQITAPPGHAVVLGATPTDTMTSVFVVQVLPQKPRTAAPPR